MELWTISLTVQDKYKNIFSDYVETIEGYVSSSLFVNESLLSKSISKKKNTQNFYNYLGEFHNNDYWLLEVLVNEKPSFDIIQKKINDLAKKLKISPYTFQNSTYSEVKNKKYIYLKKIENKNWLKENRKSFPTIEVDNFYIFGSHIKKNNLNNTFPIKINASTAFGTGSHPTTKCCLKSITYLSKSFRPNKVLDYGCGTGILGIASKKIFRKSKITLVDIDKEAIKLSKENIKLNNILSYQLYITNKYFFFKYIKNNNYELVVANILFLPLYNLAPLFKSVVKTNCYLILSGLLDYQIPRMIRRYNNFGFIKKKIILSSGWGAIIMRMNS